MSRRAAAIVAAASMTLGGMAVSYVVPATQAADDLWFAAREGWASYGLATGLLVALVGTHTASAFGRAWKRRGSSAK